MTILNKFFGKSKKIYHRYEHWEKIKKDKDNWYTIRFQHYTVGLGMSQVEESDIFSQSKKSLQEYAEISYSIATDGDTTLYYFCWITDANGNYIQTLR